MAPQRDKLALLSAANAVLATVSSLAGILSFGVAVYALWQPGLVVDWLKTFQEEIQRNTEEAAQNTGRTADNTANILATSTQIQRDTDRIASALPLWPKFMAPQFYFDPPRTAEFEFSSENILNVVVYKFSARLIFTGPDVEQETIEMVNGGIIPPFESTKFTTSVVKEPWLYDTLLAERFTLARLCLSGELENTLGSYASEDRLFFEERTYSLSEKGNIDRLQDRTFSTTEIAGCR